MEEGKKSGRRKEEWKKERRKERRVKRVALDKEIKREGGVKILKEGEKNGVKKRDKTE